MEKEVQCLKHIWVKQTTHSTNYSQVNEKILPQKSNVCKEKGELNIEINESWELRKKNTNGRYSERKMKVRNTFEGRMYRRLQNKMWRLKTKDRWIGFHGKFSIVGGWCKSIVSFKIFGLIDQTLGYWHFLCDGFL